MITVIYHPPGMKVRIAIQEPHDGIEVLGFCLGHHFPNGAVDERWNAMQARQLAEAKAKRK